MGFDIGIVGLPSAGKSTLFNAITKAGAQVGNFPFTTIDKNEGIAAVPDERFDKLVEIVRPMNTVPNTIKFVDIAGLVKGASQGEGLGNQFLGHIREVDAICHVVRGFVDDNVVHVFGSVDPARDIEVINIELAFADMSSVERRLSRESSKRKSGDRSADNVIAFLEQLLKDLEQGIPARSQLLNKEKRAALPLGAEEVEVLFKEMALLTAKPVIYAVNLTEDELAASESDPDVGALKVVRELAALENAEVIPVSAKFEAELAELSDEERAEFMTAQGISVSGTDRLARAGFRLLGLITYFTAGEKEVRAWTITEGTKAPGAAGKIHTDFEKGFIKAEVIGFEEFAGLGSFASAKEKGRLRIEGKDYVVADGDIITFRFNV